MQNFDAIRPYRDEEVGPVIQSLLQDREFLHGAVLLRLPKRLRFLSAALIPVARWLLGREVAGINNVADVQRLMRHYVKRLVQKTTSNFTYSGLEKLPRDRPFLFVGNHRDIVLDPMLVNYALYIDRRETTRIAVGENLFGKAFADKLMRLNKSFVVRRHYASARDARDGRRLLSSYIRHSLEQDQVPLWIAQRNGRAKDGNDFTHPGLIKMLCLSKTSGESLGDCIQVLGVVPVTVSYEYDPCDERKARELYFQEKDGQYHKEPGEDMDSIAAGLAGRKGRVHVAFSTPLEGDFNTAEEVAAAIDRRILSDCLLYPTNFFACRALQEDCPAEPCGPEGHPFQAEALREEEASFLTHIGAMPEAHRPYVLNMYANPLRNRVRMRLDATAS